MKIFGAQECDNRVIDKILELHDRDDPSVLTGLATGFTGLDQLTSGMQGGDLIIVAGRPSTGKTALAMCIGRLAARQFSIKDEG